MMKLFDLKSVSLKSHAEINEKMIQAYLAEHPECLKLGNLSLVERERPVLNGGYIDLVLKDSDDELARYVVEVQLGEVDPSHIVRIADYVEQSAIQYPRYEHVGVLIAENVTYGRYANFLRNYSQFYHLVVFQMNAVETEDGVGLMFTKILDGRSLDFNYDDSQQSKEPATREWLEAAVGKDIMSRIDVILEKIVNALDSNAKPNYTKKYVGLTYNGSVNNWIVSYPHKTYVDVVFNRCTASEEEIEAGKKCGLKITCRNNATIVKASTDITDEQIALMRELAVRSRNEYFD